MTSSLPTIALDLRAHDPGSRPTFAVTVEDRISEDHARSFYDLYLAAFGPLRTRAAARQVLHEQEFFGEMNDPRIAKYVAWNCSSEPVAMGTLTRNLEAIPWISPEYFVARFPEQAARSAIYYLGYVLVHPSWRHHHLVQRLVEVALPPLIESQAGVAFDVCSFNDDTLGFSTRLASLLRDLTGAELERIDTQNYYQVTFT